MLKIKLEQDAYFEYVNEFTSHYTAPGVDEEDNSYYVVWDIISDDSDESNRCDWDNPSYIYNLHTLEYVSGVVVIVVQDRYEIECTFD